MINEWLKRFSTMPIIMRIIFLVMILSPLIAFASVLTGSVLQANERPFVYGAAKDLMELTLVIVATLPAVAFSVLIFMKRKIAMYLFPLSCICVFVAPYFLSVLREDLSGLINSLWIDGIFVALLCCYFYLSKEVRKYFSGPE